MSQHKLDKFFANSAYRMIDISAKQVTYRRAIAQGSIFVGKKAFQLIYDNKLPKGDPLLLAEVAGINGAKNAYQTIPLCHPLSLEQVSIQVKLDKESSAIYVYCMVSTCSKTGVEMEALAGVNSALLTIYDLTKMVEPALTLSDVRLLYKEGGKSGVWQHPDGMPSELQSLLENKPEMPLRNIKAVVLTISDRASSGDYNDKSGELLQKALTELGCEMPVSIILPDEKTVIIDNLQTIVQQEAPQLIITTGGTGLSTRDVTPEAIMACCDKMIPGFGEKLRKDGEKHTSYAWLSRSIAAVIKHTLVIALPGNPKAIQQSIDSIKNLLPHSLDIINGEKHD